MRLLIALLLMSFFLIGCTTFKGGQSAESESCTEKALKLVPHNVTISYEDSIVNRDWLYLASEEWLDGTAIKEEPLMAYFKKGYQKGQNVNYFYAEEIPYREGYRWVYKRDIISSDGVILGTRSFRVKPVLKPIPGTEAQEEKLGFSVIHQKYELVEAWVDSCAWV